MDFWRILKTQKLGPSELRRTREDYGLKVISVAKTSTVDLVAVHGLNGHCDRTWTADSGVNWLRDLLPTNIPNARILTYGYNARTHGATHMTAQFLYEHAVTFLDRLHSFRRNTNSENRPIIFLAHSLGGILVKSALIHSCLGTSESRSIQLSTHGIIFFGTPHAGSNAAVWATALLKIGSLFAQTNTAVIRHLTANSEWLRMQLDQFVPISADLALIFCYESHKTPVLLGHSTLIVPRQSATLAGFPHSTSLSLARNHTELVRYSSDEDQDYLIVLSHLQKLVTDSEAAVSARWSQFRSNHASATEKYKEAPAMKKIWSLRLGFTPLVEQNPHFTGRNALLEAMHKRLFPQPSEDDSPNGQVLVLYGLGGIGKTQLSLHYAMEHRNDFAAILWVDGSSERSMRMGFRDIAQRYLEAAKRTDDEGVLQLLLSRLPVGTLLSSSGQIASEEATLGPVTDAVLQLLTSEYDDAQDPPLPWLMIVDNMDEPLEYPASRLIPRSQNGRVIITTRLTANTHLGEALEVDRIETEAAVAILINTARLRLQTASDKQHAEEIAEVLGCLPLALEQAGAFISEAQLRLDEYIPLLEKNRHRLLRDVKSTTSRTSVFDTLELSFQRLQSKEAAASDLLSLLACLDHSTVWEGLLLLPFTVNEFKRGYSRIEAASSIGTQSFAWLESMCRDEFKLKTTLGKIMSVSLAKRGTQPGSVYLHPLVHSWARDRLSVESRTRKLVHALVVVGQALESIYCRPVVTRELWEVQLRIQPHMDTWLELSKETDSSGLFEMVLSDRMAATALFYVGRFLQDLGRLKEAEHVLRLILDAHNPVTKPGLIPNAKRLLGAILNSYSRYDEGEILLRESETELDALFGGRHPDTLSAQFELGFAYHRCYRHEEADEMLRKVMTNDTDPSGAMGGYGREAASILGLVYRHKGLPQEGLEILDAALKYAREETQGGGQGGDDDIGSLLNLQYRRAIILYELGSWKDAAEAYREVYHAQKARLGREHPTVLKAANALGNLCCALGRYSESRELLTLARDGQDKMGFSEDSETMQLRTLFNMGVLDREEGLYNESFERLHRAYKTHLGLHGKAAYQTLWSQTQLGVLLCERGDALEATALLESCLDAQMCDGVHRTGSTMLELQMRTALAEALLVLGRVDEASTVLEPAVTAVSTDMDPENPRRLMVEVTAANVAAHVAGMSSPLDALRAMPDLLRRLDSILGGRHVVTTRTKAIHAELQFKTGQTERGREMIQAACDELAETLGPSHPKVMKLVEAALGMLETGENDEDKEVTDGQEHGGLVGV